MKDLVRWREMRKLLSSLRTFLLEKVGTNRKAQSVVAARCLKHGVSLTFEGQSLLLTSGGKTIQLQPKHLPFAPGIARRFDAFFFARPLAGAEIRPTVDYRSPEILLTVRRVDQTGAKLLYKDAACWLQKDTRVMLLQQKHFIYVADMAESFDLYFSPVEPTRNGDLLIVDYSLPGRLQTYRNSGLQFEMASFPEEEEAIEEYFHWYKPKPGDTVFDLGAHCGISTYQLAQMVGPEGRVIAFEPDPLNFELLRRNLARHSQHNVTALNIAISGQSGTAPYNCEGTIGSGLASLLERASVGRTIEVETVTLADAFQRWGRPDFCKIDIEGAELEVLASSKELLTAHKIHLALDTNHFVNGVLTNRAVERMLRSYGYRTLSACNPLMTTWARPK